MATVRKNQADLSAQEWTAFINAINATHGIGIPAPRYRDFVRVHVQGMTSPAMHEWGVHTMPGMPGRNFLAWHRQYLLQIERRLQVVDPSVALPYWDWVRERRLPAALNRSALLEQWGVARNWNARLLPTSGQVDALKGVASFDPFQLSLEQLHNNVHRAVGGIMATASSPSDPLFWLHHANVDRLWASWQQRHSGARPANRTETLQPPPLLGNRVSSVLNLSKLGYRYS